MDKITLSLNEKELSIIAEALSIMPYAQVVSLISNIQSQINEKKTQHDKNQ